MPKTENVVLTNMCMVTDGTKVLVQNRKDPDWPGLVFPGGKIEPNEPFVSSAIREVFEETGLTVSDLQLCGIKQFTHNEGLYRYIVFLYKTSTFSGDLCSSDEGEVFWLERSELMQHSLADGFAEMLPIFEDDQLSELYFDYKNHQWASQHL
ncbi:8-oxo-dGTP diphosphatase [Streptococcus ovuberis]|uniref:8-oxo-dGTP diphosphatase n=1 Tax=Streptococcus ovuberis TaxID=1936207 RepID=A0A7X6S186_9STRE|nr:8-oxo-dGTP diphosphatase [Streptococcus ovuberis]NKZ20899.1 8-oxo-dGTP diphosphatase [Streptococcus ovuberis]